MPSPLTHLVAGLMLERPARRAGIAALEHDLARGLDTLPRRFSAPKDPARAGTVLRHIIGIERWGQRRLQVALGELPFERDAYHPYAPADGLDLASLLDELRATRRRTLELARRIAQADAGDARVEHNAIGALSAMAWLRYLHLHADLEARRVRRARTG